MAYMQVKQKREGLNIRHTCLNGYTSLLSTSLSQVRLLKRETEIAYVFTENRKLSRESA